MGYFQVGYDFSVVNYDRRGFIILATGDQLCSRTSDYASEMARDT